MQTFSIVQAAKLVKKARSTVYRHIEKGKLSTVKDADNNDVIEMSELIRVYGEININDSENSQVQQTSHAATSTITDLVARIATLEAQLKAKDEVLEERQKLVDAESKRADDLKQSMLLIENKQRRSFFDLFKR